MNAINFIKQHGVDKAREVVDKNHECHMPEVFKYWSEQFQDFVLAPKYASCLVLDLKRLVESVDLVKSYGGIINAKHDVKYLDLDWDYDTPRVTRLKQAIADYESIYSNDMGDDSHIENHVSPNCKKFDERVK